MQSLIENVALVETGGRRSGIDRRTFSYTCYIPERRMGADRRSGRERRKYKRLSVILEVDASQTADLPDATTPP